MNINDKLNDMRLILQGQGKENAFYKFLQEMNAMIRIEDVENYSRITSIVSLPYSLYIPVNDNRIFIEFNIPREIVLYMVSSFENHGKESASKETRNANKRISMPYNNFLYLLDSNKFRYLMGLDYADRKELCNGMVDRLYDDITIIKDNPFLGRTTEEELALKLKAYLSWKEFL